MVLLKHRVNAALEFSTIRFVNKAYVHLEVLQAITSSPLFIKTDLIEPRLTLSIPFHHVLKGNLL
jgi:hypothetical protein